MKKQKNPAMTHARTKAQRSGLAWRLPTRDELKTLLDGSRINPASAFPDMPSLRFCSSSPPTPHNTSTAT
ncbi:MAG: DUF1566 domain-containing protein [Nitrospira sp.]|nr:DUF1566 domain-containing protein [Nitrospira sp.]